MFAVHLLRVVCLSVFFVFVYSLYSSTNLDACVGSGFQFVLRLVCQSVYRAVSLSTEVYLSTSLDARGHRGFQFLARFTH